MHEEHWTSSEQETLALARLFARRLRRGDVVALQGELGTGKTRFVKGICEALGASQHVSSPSFIILNRYEGLDADGRELFVFHLICIVYSLWRRSTTSGMRSFSTVMA